MLEFAVCYIFCQMLDRMGRKRHQTKENNQLFCLSWMSSFIFPTPKERVCHFGIVLLFREIFG